jgi:hypothetical protein
VLSEPLDSWDCLEEFTKRTELEKCEKVAVGDNGRITSLNLDRQSLSELPDLTNLEMMSYLSLEENQLQQLPMSLLRHQPALVHLQLKGNRQIGVAQLDSICSNMTQLKYLDIRDMGLIDFPFSIGSLRARECQVDCLDSWSQGSDGCNPCGGTLVGDISAIAGATDLSFYDLHLKEIPETLFQLPALTSLDVSNSYSSVLKPIW